MRQGTILAIGPKAIDPKEKVLIFFGQEATEALKEYSIIQEIQDSAKLEIKKGDKISFGDQVYTVDYVGNVANQTLQVMQHVTFLFNEVPTEHPLASAIYLSPTKLPEIQLGMKVSYL